MKKPVAGFLGVSPVLLSSSCAVAQNNSAIPKYDELAYPFRKAVIIEEIRWTMRYPTTGAFEIGSLVSTRMTLGHNYLMRDPVPVWLLGTMMTGKMEALADTYLTTDTVYSHYRWRLPEPLYVDAGQVLRSTFSREADGFASDVTVQVSYVGRTVSPDQPRPNTIAVPYAAPFLTTLAQTYQQSNEKHLFNPFDKPIRIQRLTGRMLSFVSGSSAIHVQSLTPQTAGASVTLLIDDSWGGKMVNNNTGPGDVFDALRCAWTVDTMMPPKGIYNVRVWNINAAKPIHIAMIGVREEAQ